VTAVIPTLGRSPWLGPCLEALRRDAPEIEIVLIDQGEKPVGTDIADIADMADKTFRLGRNLGFASATNLGISASTREFVATVNDDAVIEPGWTGRLVEALDREPRAAAAQGVNLILGSPGITDIADIADGCGIAWNRWTQAVQVGHGEPAPDPAGPVRDIFGVSATAALYRRQALPDGPFDPGLVSYYEDVDLAVRLQAAGWKALLVPAARARHAGSVTGATLSRERWRLLYGNRWIVARRAFGRRPWLRMAVRDLLDLLHAALSLDGARVAGILGGWMRAVRF
jgi:hypothetical protein